MKKVTILPNGTHSVDLSGIDALQKALGKRMVSRVGVLGKSPGREEGQVTNADLGLWHEYGSSAFKVNYPARSWLRMPLQLYMPAIYKEIAASFFKTVLSGAGTADAIYKQKFALLGKRAEAVIQRAFATGGFGAWAKNAPATVRAKRGGTSPLIDTGELRKSITSDVVVKGL